MPLTSPRRGRGVRGFSFGNLRVAGFRVRDSTLTKLTHLVNRGTAAYYVIVTGHMTGRTSAKCGGGVSSLVRVMLSHVWATSICKGGFRGSLPYQRREALQTICRPVYHFGEKQAQQGRHSNRCNDYATQGFQFLLNELLSNEGERQVTTQPFPERCDLLPCRGKA